MKNRRFFVLLVGFLAFAMVYFILDLGLNFLFNESIATWKSLSVAAISAAVLMHEGLKTRADLKLRDIWTNQTVTFNPKLNIEHLTAYQAALSKLGYQDFTLKNNVFSFKKHANWYTTSFRYKLMFMPNKSLLNVKSQSGFNLISMGKTKTDIEQIANTLKEVTSLSDSL